MLIGGLRDDSSRTNRARCPVEPGFMAMAARRNKYPTSLAIPMDRVSIAAVGKRDPAPLEYAFLFLLFGSSAMPFVAQET